MKYIKGFDTLRALAVILIIITHWGPRLKPNTLPDFIKTSVIMEGPFSVYLFFVLSGFLITTILLHEKEKSIDNNKAVIMKNFFVRRILRIFPIYYLFILFCILINLQFVKDNIWYFLTYTSNLLAYHSGKVNVLNHTWTLSIEEQFYLVWPWLIIFINNKYLKPVMVFCIVTGLVSRYIVIFILHHGFPFLSINCMDSFGWGGLYAFMRMGKDGGKKFEKALRTVLPLMLFVVWRMTPYSGVTVAIIYEKLLCDIMSLALIMFVLTNEYEWVRKYILENKVFNSIGRVSYGIYLYHYMLGPRYDEFMVEYVKAHPSTPSFLYSYYPAYCIKLVMLYILAQLSFKFIELPMLRLKKKFEYTSEDKIRNEMQYGTKS